MPPCYSWLLLPISGYSSVQLPNNWKQHNNFRSGDVSPADGSAAPDLKVKASVCQFQCLEQSIQLWVNLGNEGASALTAGATISVYGVALGIETLITELPFNDLLDAGQYADALGFQIDGTDYEFLRVRATANLRRPARYLDPGVPDQERALARRGVSLVGTVKSGALVCPNARLKKLRNFARSVKKNSAHPTITAKSR